MKMTIIKNKTISSIIFVIAFSIIIRLLSLLNRVILNRMLGIEGVSLYTISIPTIMLFVSLGSISLNTSINQLVSKNKNCYDKKLLKDALILAIISSSISSLILLIIIRPLTSFWLKTPLALIPILASLPLIFLTSITSILRGLYNGLSNIKLSQFSIFVEQIFRITFQVILLIISNSILNSVIYAILAMSIGELSSIVYLLLKLKRLKFYKSDTAYNKNILSLAIPSTLTHLISSITSFLEPIIFTLTYSKLNYDPDLIRTYYSEISAYILPTISMFLFISASLSPILIQKVTYYNINNDHKSLHKIISKILFFILLSSIIILTFLYFYGTDIIKFLYNYSIDDRLIKKFIFFFILVYIESPLIAIIQGLQDNRKIFNIILISSIIKLIILLIFPFIFKINPNELIIISYLFSISFISISSYKYIRKKLDFKFPFKYLVYLIIFFLFIISLFQFISLLF